MVTPPPLRDRSFGVLRVALSALVAISALTVGLRVGLAAVQPGFTVEQILSLPTPDNLVASPVGSTIAWTFNERGVRNVYAADGPSFAPRRLTAYTEDDGQELTQLSFSSDGRVLVYVRGGDHGSNRPADPPNPSGSTTQPKVQVWAVSRRRWSADAARRVRRPGNRAGRDARRLRPRPSNLVRADRRIETEADRSCVLRAREQPVARMVPRRSHARVRLEPRRSQLHRTLHARSADSVSRAVHLARLRAGLVDGRKEDRISAAAWRRRCAAIAADRTGLDVVGRRGGSRSTRPAQNVSGSDVVTALTSGESADRCDPAQSERHRPAVGRRRHLGVSLLQGRLAASVLAAPSRHGQPAAAAHARLVHGRAVRAHARSPLHRLQRQHRCRSRRRRSPASVQGADRRRHADAVDERKRHRMESGHAGGRSDGGVPEGRRASAAAARRCSSGRRERERDCGRPRAVRLPCSSARRARAGHVPRKRWRRRSRSAVHDRLDSKAGARRSSTCTAVAPDRCCSAGIIGGNTPTTTA